MRRILDLSALGLAFLLAGCGSGASSNKTASTTPSPIAVQEPVVATSFLSQHPTPGQRERVNVQFFRGTHRLSGGHLSVTVTYGKRTLHLKGGTTNKQGMASATFTVPKVAKGTALQAATTVQYKGSLYKGSNQVTVGG